MSTDEIIYRVTTCIQGLLIPGYTAYMINTFKNYGDVIQTEFKFMVVLFYVLMFVHFAFGVWGTYNNDGYYNFKNGQIYSGWYILDRVYLILLYKFLLILKRVQFMTDRKYDDIY